MKRSIIIGFCVLGIFIISNCKESNREGSNVSEQPKQSVQNQSDTRTVALGRVTKDGNKYTIYDTNGKQVTYQSQPNTELIGVGTDFSLLDHIIRNSTLMMLISRKLAISV